MGQWEGISEASVYKGVILMHGEIRVASWKGRSGGHIWRWYSVVENMTEGNERLKKWVENGHWK